MSGMGFNNSLFNIEFMYNPRARTIHIIEINPRMAAQFADLYEKVDGFNAYEVLFALAIGERPSIQLREGRYRMAASCVCCGRLKIILWPRCRPQMNLNARYCRTRVRAWNYGVKKGKNYPMTYRTRKASPMGT
jgi:predicted ATP-grasp superfamily ATP-dependent carboligase